MRSASTISPTDRILLIGSDETAMAALWRLCAAGARIRWYADRADVGAETVLAHALGGGRIELCFDDPHAAPLGDAAAIVVARNDDCNLRIAERARASAVPVHVTGRPDLSSIALADLECTAPPAWRSAVSEIA